MNEDKKKLESKNALKKFGMFVAIFLVLSLVFGVILYYGLWGVPSSATYLTNYNNLDNVKTWDQFKANYSQLDPSILQSPYSAPSNVKVTVSGVSLQDSLIQPKSVFSFDISIDTTFNNAQYSNSKTVLTQPSLLILLLDQQDEIRGKLYTEQYSPDSFMTGNNQTDYTFWFKIPSDMQNQPITVIAEVFGIEQTTVSNQFASYGTAINLVDDSVYGSIPAPQSQISQPNSVDLSLLDYARAPMHTPTTYSIWELASYSEVLALVITAFGAVVYLIRDKTVAWWNQNKVNVIFGIMFLITYLIILVIVGLLM